MFSLNTQRQNWPPSTQKNFRIDFTITIKIILCWNINTFQEKRCGFLDWLVWKTAKMISLKQHSKKDIIKRNICIFILPDICQVIDSHYAKQSSSIMSLYANQEILVDWYKCFHLPVKRKKNTTVINTGKQFLLCTHKTKILATIVIKMEFLQRGEQNLLLINLNQMKLLNFWRELVSFQDSSFRMLYCQLKIKNFNVWPILRNIKI